MKKILQSNTIKDNINRLLKNRNWTQAELERKVGGKRNVSNIMRGASKYPTIEVLQRIANAFNVDIAQLIVEENYGESPPVDYNLLSESFTKVILRIKPFEGEYKVKPENILSLVVEVYNYSYKLKLDTVDEKFVDWVISKYYS
jgi:transcriptional regulator with XRE-family HTH domain